RCCGRDALRGKSARRRRFPPGGVTLLSIIILKIIWISGEGQYRAAGGSEVGAAERQLPASAAAEHAARRLHCSDRLSLHLLIESSSGNSRSGQFVFQRSRSHCRRFSSTSTRVDSVIVGLRRLYRGLGAVLLCLNQFGRLAKRTDLLI